MKFIDEARIEIHAGKGGDGVVSFRREKNVPRGGPDGGDGGGGGGIYALADRNINTLVEYRFARIHRARDGGHGRGAQCSGKSADDVVLRMPGGTVITDAQTGEAVAEGGGLGHQFLRHLARTRLLLHIVDAAPVDDGADPVRDASAIAAELRKFDPTLQRKPRWLVLNKMDMLPAAEREAVAAKFARGLRWRGPSFCISALTGEGCRELSFAVMKFLETGKAA